MLNKILSVMVTLTAVGALGALGACGLGDSELDKGEVQSQIAGILDESYSGIGQSVSSVRCDIDDPKPAPGTRFVCLAQVGDAQVQVDATVKDEDRNVDIAVRQKLYSLPDYSAALAAWASKRQGSPMAVDCGTGLRAAMPGDSFDCKATGASGKVSGLIVTVGPIGGADEKVLLGS